MEDISDNIDELLELDTDWIDELEKQELPYENFYKENVDNVNIFYIYINNNNNIYNIKKEELPISESILRKEKLVYLIKKYRNNNQIKHNLISVLQYNIDISPDDIKDLLKNKNLNFLSVKNSLNDIKWNDTIQYFKKINALYILFYQEKKTNKKNIYTKCKIEAQNNKEKGIKKTTLLTYYGIINFSSIENGLSFRKWKATG